MVQMGSIMTVNVHIGPLVMRISIQIGLLMTVSDWDQDGIDCGSIMMVKNHYWCRLDYGGVACRINYDDKDTDGIDRDLMFTIVIDSICTTIIAQYVPT